MQLHKLSIVITALTLGLVLHANGEELPRWGSSYVNQDAEWYASEEARTVAENLLAYQSTYGAWPKNRDFTVLVPADEIEVLNRGGKANTIDNDGTTLPMRFMALVADATGNKKYVDAFLRGVDYLLEAQYENGGWPQYYPLRKGYYSRITFNDDAMMNVMFLLRDVAAGEEPYAFVDADRAAKAADAVALGIDCILKTQVRHDGKLAGWAAQYDEVTLEPTWARTYEPPALSGQETVSIVQFLIQIEEPTPEQVAAVEGSVAWLKAVAIQGFSYHQGVDADGVRDAWIVADETAGPLWARFYELGTNRPLFLGRDSVFRYSHDQIEQERRSGYAYYGTWPKSLLEKDYPRWRARLAPGLLGIVVFPLPCASVENAK